RRETSIQATTPIVRVDLAWPESTPAFFHVFRVRVRNVIELRTRLFANKILDGLINRNWLHVFRRNWQLGTSASYSNDNQASSILRNPEICRIEDIEPEVISLLFEGGNDSREVIAVPPMT